MNVKIKIKIAGLLAVALLLAAGSAKAVRISIQNACFETTNALTTSCTGPGTCANNAGPIP
jgi:hypothetical protein